MKSYRGRGDDLLPEPSALYLAIIDSIQDRHEQSKRLGKLQHEVHLMLEVGPVRKILDALLVVDIICVVVLMIIEIQYLESVKHDYIQVSYLLGHENTK